jgi:ubiquitin-like protein Pup
MSQRESAGQRRVERAEDVEEPAVATTTEKAPSELDADVDAILDEIDSVLEENAEDFVKSFVQKGGQ